MKITAILYLIAVLLSSCASFEPQPISLTDTIAAYEAHTLDNPALRQYLARTAAVPVPAHPVSGI